MKVIKIKQDAMPNDDETARPNEQPAIQQRGRQQTQYIDDDRDEDDTAKSYPVYHLVPSFLQIVLFLHYRMNRERWDIVCPITDQTFKLFERFSNLLLVPILHNVFVYFSALP